MTALAAPRMAHRLTVPFGRGADTLSLALTPVDAGQAAITPYTFLEHRALFNSLPDPRYVLTLQRDISTDTQVTVDFEVEPPGNTPAPGTTGLTVPAGTRAGTSFLLNLVGNEGPDTHLLRLHMAPPAPDGAAAGWWQITALLGNIAKLLWVLGCERDSIRRHLEIVQAQRHLPAATGPSLDLAGYDLGVPRFPPQPYAFDPACVALYHLDDPPTGAPAQIQDAMAQYGLTGHPGTVTAAQSGFPGRFGQAYAFRDAPGNAVITIADHPDFALAAGDSFTAECFVRPDTGAADGHVLAKDADPANAGQPGWALSVGDFGRGIALNVRFLLGDGTRQVSLFADTSLAGTHFQHLAGVVDRQRGQARLYVDGVLRAAQSIANLTALSNNAPLQIGRTGTAPYRGLIDEVRLTRAALTDFHPVLGEADGQYRRRLAIFERWTLPAPSNLQSMLNEAAGTIGGDAQPLTVNDEDATLVAGSQPVTVVPHELEAGECMDVSGNRRVREADVNGTAAGESSFDARFLLQHNDPRVIYTPPPPRALGPGELPPDPHRMQLAAETPLNRLLDLAAGEAPGHLVIQSGFDPRAGDLRAVGRGLLFTHENIARSRLAALAHEAGFSYVCHRADLGAVYASVPPGEYLEIKVTGGTAGAGTGFDLLVTETLDLEVRPPQPVGTLYRWLTIACGAGRADLTPRTDRPTVTVKATAPGDLTVKIETSQHRYTAGGTRVFRIGIASLADGASLGDDGTQGVSEDIAADTDPFFHPSYLVTHADARATYTGGVNSRRMQPSVASRLTHLLDLIAATGAAGTLQIAEAWVPNANDLRGAGRRLTVQHTALAVDRLGALAHTAGFTYVRRQGAQIQLAQSPDDLVTIVGPQQVAEGASIDLTMHPLAAPTGIAVSGASVYTANSGTDTVSEIDPATGRVRRAIKVGWAPVAVAVSPDGKRLYTGDSAGNTVTAVDLATGAIAGTVAVQPSPAALAHHPTQPRLYVACAGSGTVTAIDTSALTVAGTVAAGNQPTGLAVTPDGTAVWVAVSQDARVAILTTSPFAASATIAIGAAVQDIAIAPDGAHAFVTQPAAARLAVLNVAPRTVGSQVSLGAAPVSQPDAVTVSPTGGTVYVTDRGTAGDQLRLLAPDGTAQGTVRLRHGPGRLAVRVDGASEHIYVANAGGNDVSVIDRAETGLADTWQIGSGLGERLTWVLHLAGPAQATLSSTTTPSVTLKGDRAGNTLVRAVYLLPDNPDPYTVEVRLKPALEAAGAVIHKDQYDLIMNILNAFHPIGVEVRTRALRERVIEVRAGQLDAFPAYTYPNFRVRGPAPQPARKE